MNKTYLIIGGIVVLGVLGFLVLGGSSKSPNSGQSTQQVTQTPKNPQTFQRGAEETVMVTESGFDPETITIKVGTRVIWMNKSGKTVTVNSDDHPTHKKYPFLNLGAFEANSSVQAVFDKAGTYTYHDHFNPSHTGKVTVQ